MKHSLSSLLVLSFLLLAPVRGVEIIGHRGASHDAPENTVASFKLGWEQQADADELDIYLTKDGKVLVSHDASTKRITGVDKKIADSTVEELQALDAGSFKGEQWKGEKLPTLAEVLATIPEGKRIFIEIKCGAEVLPELENVMKASGRKPEQLVIIGFSHAVMQAARQRLPQAPIYWIVSPKADKETGQYPPIEDLIDKAKEAGLSGLDLDAKYPLDATAVAKVKAAGLRLYTWTVDDIALAQKLTAAGVDGLTTNRPGWLREQLK